MPCLPCGRRSKRITRISTLLRSRVGRKPNEGDHERNATARTIDRQPFASIRERKARDAASGWTSFDVGSGFLLPSASFPSKRCTRKFAERISGLGGAHEKQFSAAMRGGAARAKHASTRWNRGTRVAEAHAADVCATVMSRSCGCPPHHPRQ